MAAIEEEDDDKEEEDEHLLLPKEWQALAAIPGLLPADVETLGRAGIVRTDTVLAIQAAMDRVCATVRAHMPNAVLLRRSTRVPNEALLESRTGNCPVGVPKGLSSAGSIPTRVLSCAMDDAAAAAAGCRFTTGRWCGLLEAVILACNARAHLHLDPDVVWATIVSAVPTPVAGDSTLALALPGMEIDWQQLSKAVVVAAGTPLEQLQPHFTTTTGLTRAVCEVMTAMPAVPICSYPSYNDTPTRGGIASVAFGGRLADWEALRGRAAALAHIPSMAGEDAQRWLAVLDSTLERLVATAAVAFAHGVLGEHLREWWAHIYTHHNPHAAGKRSTVTGWVLTLFMHDAVGSIIHWLGDARRHVAFEDLPCRTWRTVPIIQPKAPSEQQQHRMHLSAGCWDALVDVRRGVVTPRLQAAVSTDAPPAGDLMLASSM